MRTTAALAIVLLAVSASATAPEKLPLPFVGSDKPDPWGTPTKTADKIALRKLLFARQFAELTQVLEGLQAVAESDCKLELVGLDAFEAFSSADPELEYLLKAWVEASPESYAPLVARGAWGVAMAQERRGRKYASETTPEQWEGMSASAETARSDLDASLVKHATFAARRALMDLNLLTSTTEPAGKSQLDFALKQCPASLFMNMKATVALAPRWGGSAKEMVAFVKKLPTKKNPKLKVLAGTVEDDLGTSTSDASEALLHFDRALQAGPYWEYLFDKSYALLRLGRAEEALAAADQAALQRPQKPRIHVVRWQALRQLRRGEEARAAYDLVIALDPYEHYLKYIRN